MQILCNSSYLLVVVEAVHNGGLSGRQLGDHVQQLQNNFLLVVNDGQMQSTVICRWDSYTRKHPSD